MVKTPVSKPCDPRYQAVNRSGPRPAGSITLVCIHCTEGDTAVSAARWFTNTNSKGSAHLVVDDENCFRTLPDLMIPWAAPGANKQGYHIEIAGYAAWSEADWRKRPGRLRRAAYKAALRCNDYDIPVRWVGPIGLRLGRKGLTTHKTVTTAYPRLGDGHTDPGDGFPKAAFLALVKGYLEDLQEGT